MSSRGSISTLSEFLLQAHTQHHVFDVGRGIRKVANQTFFDWENQVAPCAYPRQDHAWFCIVFWNDKLNAQRYIWFIKLPLDENGLIVSAALQQFLDIIVQALGKELEHTENSQAQLPQNPYVFTPSQQQLADCNAHIRKVLALPSKDNTAALNYLKAPNATCGQQVWEGLSLQDIADFVIHPALGATNTNSLQTLIATNMAAYPGPVLNCLFASLETVAINEVLARALVDFHRTAPEPNLAALCLRAMSHAPHPISLEYIKQLIDDNPNETTKTLDIETCVVIVGRYWQVLTQAQRLHNFMHKVTLIDPSHGLFKGLYADLVKIPETRSSMLSFIRQTERTPNVAEAIGALFASA